MQVCCAWDLYITMGEDQTVAGEVSIPSVYVTMRDSAALLSAVASSSSSTPGLTVQISDRPRPWVNVSSFLIWAMGVTIVSPPLYPRPRP